MKNGLFLGYFTYILKIIRKYYTALSSYHRRLIMTDRTQFEAMLEALINEDQETAKEIFHNIVVAKSREIYEQLLSEDFDLNEKAEEEEEEEEEEESRKDESYEEGSEEEEEEGSDSDVGGDATDDFIDDVEDSEGDEEDHHADVGGEEEIEDRVMDLEDALEELKAEFEQLMAGDDEGGEMGDMGAGDMGAGDMDDGADDMFAKEMSQMMEYVNKVAPPKHGDNGVNTKSTVAGKNDMGGTTANIAKSHEEKAAGTKGGLLDPSTKEDNAGNVNVPGAKSATKLSNVPAGHGAEKKGKSEQGAYTKPIVGGK